MDFIDRLKEFLAANEITHRELSQAAQIPPSTISNWVNRTRGIPAERRKVLENIMASYLQPKSAQKGSNRSTKSDPGSTVDSKLEADATRLGLAVVAVRRAEIELEKVAPAYVAARAAVDNYEVAKAAVDKAKAELEQIEASLLSKIG